MLGYSQQRSRRAQAIIRHASKFPTTVKTSSSEHTLREQIPNNGQDKLKRAYVTRANSQQRPRQDQASIRYARKFPTMVKTSSSEHTLREKIPNNGQDKLKRAHFTRANSQQRSRQAQASTHYASKFPTTVETSSSEHTLRDRFFNSGQKKGFASFNELLNFSESSFAGHLRSSADSSEPK